MKDIKYIENVSELAGRTIVRAVESSGQIALLLDDGRVAVFFDNDDAIELAASAPAGLLLICGAITQAEYHELGEQRLRQQEESDRRRYEQLKARFKTPEEARDAG